MKHAARGADRSADGAVIAFVVGAVALALGETTEQFRALVEERALASLGLVVASVLGAVLSNRVVRGDRWQAVAGSLAFGAAVPAIVAAVIAFPIAPIAVGYSMTAWPLTIPAGLAWMVLLRLQVRLEVHGSNWRRALAVALAGALLFVGFTQPVMTTSAAGAHCIAFPGEWTEALAWSPDAGWLGLASAQDDGQGVIRVIERTTGRVIELDRGLQVSVLSGIAVGPGGETTYLVDEEPESPEAIGPSIWQASPAVARHRVLTLRTPAVFGLTWTPLGVAAVLAYDLVDGEVHRLVWLRASRSPSEALERVDAATIARYPVLSLAALPERSTEPTVRVGTKNHRVPFPSDALGDATVTDDGRYLVFDARKVSDDGERVLYDRVVAQSTVTGERVVLADEPGWEAQLSAGHVAYLTFPSDKGNSACIADAPKA
jgi:hypothetical protein